MANVQQIIKDIAEGKFRVIGYGGFREDFFRFLSENFSDELEALRFALRKQEEEERLNRINPELSVAFYIVPYKGIPKPLSHYEGKVFIRRLK